MSTEEKTLLALKAHCQMTIQQVDRALKMLHEESGAVSTAPARKGRGASVADKERAIARLNRQFATAQTKSPRR